MNFKERRKNQRGNALVEFAIVLPLLVLLVFGTIDFAILIYNKAIIAHASREAARYGIVLRTPKYTPAEVKAYAESYLAGRLITFGGSAPTASVTAPSQLFGDPLTVTVNYTHNFLVVPNLAALSSTTNLSSTTVMKYE